MIKRILLLLLIPAICFGGVAEQVNSVLATHGEAALTCVDTAVESAAVEASTIGLRDDGARQKLGQTFTTTEGGGRCKKTLKLIKIGSPTGNIVGKFYATSGGLPTGSALKASPTMDVSTVSGSSTVYTFTWDIEPVTDATVYAIVLEGDFTVNASNYVGMAYDNANGYAGGSIVYYDGANWAAYAAWDLVFTVKK